MKQLELEPVIGLEIHIQLDTLSKMFCRCSNDGENQLANTTICPRCTGQPGVLPVVNEQAVFYGASLALALNLKVNPISIWARKNYFYPDLPKGYQISQFDQPLATDGFLIIETPEGRRRIGIERLHLEEDAAKNFHHDTYALVDYNRGGTPLAEIVTRPDFKTPAEARIFLQQLRSIARYLGVSQADMEKGHLRCDANISMREVGETKFHPKSEIKNLNSFRSVERALEHEIKRQTELWQKGTPPDKQATRGWDEKKLSTYEQRVKESSDDYRYFPEPDLPSLVISAEKIAELKATLPELPAQKKLRFMEEYGLNAVDAGILVEDKAIAAFFEETMSEFRAWLSDSGLVETEFDEFWTGAQAKVAKLVSGWLISELFKLLNEANLTIKDLKFSPAVFAEFIGFIYARKINSSAGQVVLKQMFATGEHPEEVIASQDLHQVSDADELKDVVEKIIKASPEQVKDYQGGKLTLIKYFLGQAMKETRGRADPEMLENIFRQLLD